MKNKILTVLITVMVMVWFTGCNTSLSYTYKVSTGDNVKIELDTTDGYSITSKVPFEISKDGDVLSNGTFIDSKQYDSYVNVINSDENAKLLDESSNDNIKYVFWNYNDTEYNYVILIQESKTGIVLGNTVSEECAKEVFKRLKITLE